MSAKTAGSAAHCARTVAHALISYTQGAYELFAGTVLQNSHSKYYF